VYSIWVFVAVISWHYIKERNSTYTCLVLPLYTVLVRIRYHEIERTGEFTSITNAVVKYLHECLNGLYGQHYGVLKPDKS
jgi:hypothetical protein